jgi:hypothetical protein
MASLSSLFLPSIPLTIKKKGVFYKITKKNKKKPPFFGGEFLFKDTQFLLYP